MVSSSAETSGSHQGASARSNLLFWSIAVLIFIGGAVLRFTPMAGFRETGYDEALYRRYIVLLDGGEHQVRVPHEDNTVGTYPLSVKGSGFGVYPQLVDFYLRQQKLPETKCELPPTRFLYIACGWLWKRAEFGSAPPQQNIALAGAANRDPELVSLHRISSFFTTLLVALSGVAGTRMLGRVGGLVTMALVACAPVQLHMSQHALIDGFFAFWAVLCLWLLWENIQRPNRIGWLLALGLSLALMVTAKENAFFVYLALCGLVIGSRFAKFGAVTPGLLVTLFVGPLAGVVLLAALAGGFGELVDVYRVLVSKAQNLDYAIKTGDGPWHRYLVDLLLVSPIVLCLAIGGVFTARKPEVFFLIGFVLFSYLIMCNVRYGMNLRYTTIWDFPLAALAATQLIRLTSLFGSRAHGVLAVLVAAIMAYNGRQYFIFTVEHKMYEMVTIGLLETQKIVK